jgi:hypothetical protein
MSYSIFDQEDLNSGLGSNLPLHRYAWLELEKGMWHFLTNLFSSTGESTRRWPDRKRALEELTSEGWKVVYPYPGKMAKKQPRDRACGYGLMWIDR